MMKKISALLLALVMALSLMACGQKEDNIGGEKKDDQTQTDGQSVDLRAAYEAGMWKNNATVTVNGNYVVLEVLPDGCTVPDAFLAKF